MMAGQRARKIALDSALCHLGDMTVNIERQRLLIEQLHASGCSTQIAEIMLRRFEGLQAHHAQMLSALQERTVVRRRPIHEPALTEA